MGSAQAMAVRLAVVVAVLAVAVGGLWGLTRASELPSSPVSYDIPALSVQAADVRPGSVAPITAGLKGVKSKKKAQGAAQQGGDPLGDWADRAAPLIGVPARALQAYGRAELAARTTQPGCNLSWATIAAIGRVESNHGQFRGAILQDSGYPSQPIIGPVLDGSGGFKAIRDTDGGVYDGNNEYDHAVGPMQFIPSTWARWASDGNRDGKGDPQQIDDAAYSAARYLCAGGRNMATADGWWRGLWSYNQSVEYGQKVFGLADQYARAINS